VNVKRGSRFFLIVIVFAMFTVLPVMGGGGGEAGETVELTFWSMWNEGEPSSAVFREWIRDYEKARPGTKVKVVFNGRENQTKLRTALAGGTKVDLMDQDALQVAGGLMVDGMGYALNDLIADAKALDDQTPFADIFVPGTLEQNVGEDGNIYLIPYILITVAFWHDNRTFDNAGVSDPETWQDLMQVCEKIEKSGIAAVAADGQADQYLEMYFYHLTQRFEGSGFLLGAVEDRSGEAWVHPSFMKSLDRCAEIRDKYFIEGWEGFVWPAGQMELAVGNAGMELCGSWLPNELKASADPEFEWGGFAFPSVSGGKGKRTDMEAYLLSWLVLKDAPHPEDAFHFINFCMMKENQVKMVNESLNASARKGLAWPDVIKDGEQMFAKATATFEGLDWMQSTYSEYFTTIFRPTLREFWLRQITPEKFISEMKAQTKKYWETR